MIKNLTKILGLIVVLVLFITACNPAAMEQTATEALTAVEEVTEEIAEIEPLEEETEEPVIEEVEETKATRPTQPTITPNPPATYRDTNFPIGVFIGHNPPGKLTLRADGSWEWGLISGGAYNKGLYGINGDLCSLMTFTRSTGSQTPVTYFWEFDGVNLTFIVNGEDLREERVENVKNNTFVYEGPSFLGTEIKEHTFPFGRFVNADGTRAFEFDEDGLWRFYEGDMEHPARSGKYVTNGDVYTEMTHVNPHEQQVPATYIWTFDGENLTFELWGEDVIPYREGMYNGQTYIWAGD